MNNEHQNKILQVNQRLHEIALAFAQTQLLLNQESHITLSQNDNEYQEKLNQIQSKNYMFFIEQYKYAITHFDTINDITGEI